NCRDTKEADVARVLHAVSVVLKPETGRCELLSRGYKRLDAAAAGVDDTTVPRRPNNYVRELEAEFPDESSARRAMEEFAGCSMRSKGGEYCVKGGARIRRYVCTFANKRGWTSCDFAARTVQSPRSGRFTVEA
ncbi:hypothetical protein FOZ61_003716, partial [Perkinsus olseni]